MSKVGIKAPFEVSEENYMVFELNSLDNKIEGTVNVFDKKAAEIRLFTNSSKSVTMFMRVILLYV